MNIKRAIPTIDIVQHHQKEFPGINVFYRGMTSKLYRWKMERNFEDQEVLTILLRFSVNVKRNVVFVHKDKRDECGLALCEAGYDFIWAEPDPEYWN